MKDYMKIYQEWLSNPYFDEATKEELRAIEGNENEIKERFYMDLEFGTAGLRGIIGAGINRMNIYVVRRATQGLANYIIKQGAANKGVAIAYDSRHMSPEFAMEAAMTLAANGIKAYKFESLRPTPELSFAVRELGCVAGINITASHNPPEYNGYKVYWEDGAQFTPPHDKGVTEEVLAIEDLSTVKTTDEASATAAGLYQVIGQEIDDKYIAQVKAQVVNQKAIDEMQDQITIVYTPLHGTGNVPARRVLKELGFTHVYVVPEQELPDGEFPTVSYPNPEAAEAFELALALVKYGFQVAEIYGTLTAENFVYLKHLSELSPQTKVFSNMEPTMIYYDHKESGVTTTIGKDACYYHPDAENVMWNKEVQPYGYAGVKHLCEKLLEV